MNFDAWIVLLYAVCYFVFGLKGAARFVNNRMENVFQNPKTKWLRYVCIAIFALVFAFIEFARLILMAILWLLRMIFRR